MNQVIYGFIDANNCLIDSAIIEKNDFQTLEALKKIKNAYDAHPMSDELEKMNPNEIIWYDNAWKSKQS